MNNSAKQHNPLTEKFNTRYCIPPFDEIRNEHFIPALKVAIDRQNEIIGSIVENASPATFENTIVPLEKSDEYIDQVNNVFSNLESANTNEQLQEISREISPMLAAQRDNVLLNEALFARVKSVYEATDNQYLDNEQKKLVKEFYDAFKRGGANLDESSKNRLREINKKLSVLSVEFSDNVLAETNNFQLVIDTESDLAGLPESVVQMGREAAIEAGLPEKWVYTLHRPNLGPFLQYSQNRALREKMYKGYINRCNNDNEFDNKEIVREMINLRIEKANLLGYKTHADLILEERVAKNPENVYELLNKLWTPARAKAMKEAEQLQKMADSELNEKINLEAWDWPYYAEKLRKQEYDLSDEELRPYFKLDNVRDGIFYVSNRLFGISFKEITDVPRYHEEVTTYEVSDTDGSLLGILMMDFHPRASKRVGAWMTEYRKQYRENGERVIPIVSIVMNFTKPSGDKPSLLNFDEVETFFHEFGHALHGLLSDCTYEELSGTSVPRDFVELPSQIMENWALEPEVLKVYAKHYETGEVIPETLIEKIKKSGQFNQGFASVEYLAASLLDMDWHTITAAPQVGVIEFEKNALNRINLIPEIDSRYRTPYFMHIFSHGYSAGYYSYIWAEVMDADAYAAFEEKGIFDSETATKFRKHILERGGTEDAMEMYLQFRGQEPSIEPLLEKRGLK